MLGDDEVWQALDNTQATADEVYEQILGNRNDAYPEELRPVVSEKLADIWLLSATVAFRDTLIARAYEAAAKEARDRVTQGDRQRSKRLSKAWKDES